MKSKLARSALRRVKAFSVAIECEACEAVKIFEGRRIDETIEAIDAGGWSGAMCPQCKNSLYRCSTALNGK